MERRDMLTMLADAVVRSRPRVFGIYGTFRRSPDIPILGWGLEFPGDDGAVFRQAGEGSVHLSDTAQRVLDAHSVIGDVSLTWLDGPWAGGR